MVIECDHLGLLERASYREIPTLQGVVVMDLPQWLMYSVPGHLCYCIHKVQFVKNPGFIEYSKPGLQI